MLIIPILTRIVGFNPIDAAIRHFNGDWEGFSACADGWSKLQNFVAALEHNLTDCTKVLGGYWSGNAADAAWDYFTGLQHTLAQVSQTFGQLSAGYQVVAAMVYNAAEDVSSLIEAEIDTILALLVTASAILQAGADVPDDFVAAVDDGATIPEAILSLGLPGSIPLDAAALAEMATIASAAIVGFTAPTSYPIPRRSYTFPP